MKSYDVRFRAIKTNRETNAKTGKKRVVSHTGRWKVERRQKSRTFELNPQAESFLSDLHQAAKNREAFETEPRKTSPRIRHRQRNAAGLR